MALISTSICIEQERLIRMTSAAEVLRMNQTELLSVLIAKSRKLFNNKAVTRRAVRYQKFEKSGDFEIYHIFLKDVDYEFATGRRYLFKLSVSFLFRLALDFFLEEIIQERSEDPIGQAESWSQYRTNYYIKFFDVAHTTEKNAEFWVIPWPK